MCALYAIRVWKYARCKILGRPNVLHSWHVVLYLKTKPFISAFHCDLSTLTLFLNSGGPGSSNRPWLLGQTGSMSSGVTRKSGARANNLSEESHPPLARDPWARLLCSTSSFNIWHGGPPGRRTNRPNWQVRGSQAAQSALVLNYSSPLTTLLWAVINRSFAFWHSLMINIYCWHLQRRD